MASLLDRFLFPVPVDDFVAAINPLWAKQLTGRVQSVTPLSPTAVAIRIRPSRGWKTHTPGQYVTVGVDIDGVRHHRCYSLISLPATQDRCIEIAVQAIADGVVSQYLLTQLRPGMFLELSEPLGEFTLPTSQVPVLFVAGGSGITPILGMIRSLAADRSNRSGAPDSPKHGPVTLVHFALDGDRALFQYELDRIARNCEWFDYHLVLNGESNEMLSAALLEHHCPDWTSRAGYACGPAPLLDSAEALWERHAPAATLATERFVLAPLEFDRLEVPGDTSAPSVGFRKSKAVSRQCPSKTLLETAEAAGVPTKAGCRAGVCHTCATRIVSGTAMDLRDGRLYETGDLVQTCVSAAATDLTLDL